jgi:hypothetical protein
MCFFMVSTSPHGPFGVLRWVGGARCANRPGLLHVAANEALCMCPLSPPSQSADACLTLCSYQLEYYGLRSCR